MFASSVFPPPFPSLRPLLQRAARLSKRALCGLVVVGLCHFQPACKSAPVIPQPRKIVDLSPVITPDLNVRRLGIRALEFLGTDGRTRTASVVPRQASLAFGLEELSLMSHTGAHLDAPARLLRGGEPPSRISLDKVYGKAHVIDLRWHNRHSPIQITDLELKPPQAGDIAILLVGYEPPDPEDWPRYPPLSEQAALWLVAKGVKAIATDMPFLSRLDEVSDRMAKGQPPEVVWAEYLPFFQSQIPIIAGLTRLEAIAREPNVVFLGFPLALSTGNGAPMRAAALVY